MNDIKQLCVNMRKDCLVMAEAAGSLGLHFGGTFSMIEIVAALYIMKMNINNNKDYFEQEERDRVIISKGHGIPSVYAVLHQAGYLTDDELKTFKNENTELFGHPCMNKRIGIEFSTGSLGMGVSQGVGVAIALKHKMNNNSRVYVILGDGECDEGMIWEAAMSAAKFALDNLIVIIDENHLQYDGSTDEIMPLLSLSDKWKSFGWNVIRVDGHDVEKCYFAICERYSKPTVIIADTVKGKGVSFMENNAIWHHKSITKSQMESAWEELGGKNDI